MEVLRHHPRNLLLSIGVGFGAFVAQATITTFVISYAVQGGFPRATVLNALTVSSAVAVFGIVGFSALSDRLGRRPVVLAGAVGMAIWAFLLFPLIDSKSTALLVVAVVVGQGVVHTAWYGPLAALYTELFSTGSRYTGASLGYQMAGLGAGIAPRRVRLGDGRGRRHPDGLDHHGGLLPGVVGCILALRETSTTDLTADPERAQAPARR